MQKVRREESSSAYVMDREERRVCYSRLGFRIDTVLSLFSFANHFSLFALVCAQNDKDGSDGGGITLSRQHPLFEEDGINICATMMRSCNMHMCIGYRYMNGGSTAAVYYALLYT